MIIVNLNQLQEDQQVDWGNGISRRLLIQKDKMKYSLTDTIIEAGSVSYLEYTHHLEACYCIEGTGSVEQNGIVYDVEPGILYALDRHDKHILRAKTRMRLICVFLPALIGNEKHHITEGQFSGYTKADRFIFVEANNTSLAGISLVRKLGYSPILFTNIREFYPDYYKASRLEKFDEVYDVDTHDAEAMYAVIRALKMNVKGVLSCFDNNTLASAYLAKKLSLPHPAIKGLKNALSKIKVRTVLENAGFTQPKFAVTNYNNIPLTPLLEYPFVIKPDNDAGSRGAFICRTLEEYSNARTKLMHVKHTETGTRRDKLLFEEYISGEFYGAELFWDREWHVLGINQIIIKPAISLAIASIIFPTDLSEVKLASIKEQILKWINCLGLKGGALNVEFKLVEEQPILIEINPRLAGARVNALLELSLGVSPVEELIYWLCDMPRHIGSLKKISNDYFVNAFYFSTGKVIDINVADVEKSNLMMLEHKEPPFVVEQGDALCVDQVVGDVIVSGQDFNSAIVNASKVIDQIKIKTMENA